MWFLDDPAIEVNAYVYKEKNLSTKRLRGGHVSTLPEAQQINRELCHCIHIRELQQNLITSDMGISDRELCFWRTIITTKVSIDLLVFVP